MNLNRIMLIGNLTRDPDARHTQSGKAVTSFTIAVNDRRSGGRSTEGASPGAAGASNEDTLFIKVTTWDRTAEIAAQYLKKGATVLVEGRLKMEEYNTREGEKRRDPVVIADQISLGPKPRGEGAEGDYGQGGGSYSAPRAAAPSPSRSAAPPRQDSGRYTPDPAPQDDFGDQGEGVEDNLPF